MEEARGVDSPPPPPPPSTTTTTTTTPLSVVPQQQPTQTEAISFLIELIGAQNGQLNRQVKLVDLQQGIMERFPHLIIKDSSASGRLFSKPSFGGQFYVPETIQLQDGSVWRTSFKSKRLHVDRVIEVAFPVADSLIHSFCIKQLQLRLKQIWQHQTDAAQGSSSSPVQQHSGEISMDGSGAGGGDNDNNNNASRGGVSTTAPHALPLDPIVSIRIDMSELANLILTEFTHVFDDLPPTSAWKDVDVVKKVLVSDSKLYSILMAWDKYPVLVLSESGGSGTVGGGKFRFSCKKTFVALRSDSALQQQTSTSSKASQKQQQQHPTGNAISDESRVVGSATTVVAGGKLSLGYTRESSKSCKVLCDEFLKIVLFCPLKCS